MSLTLPADTPVTSLQFVLRSADGSAWYRDGSSNFNVPLATTAGDAGAEGAAVVTDPLIRAIVDAENESKWTLMHRFNRVADLLDEVLAGAPLLPPPFLAVLVARVLNSLSVRLCASPALRPHPVSSCSCSPVVHAAARAGVHEDKPAAMAAIYVWLRYSATRHLTWQRNYNTQPRILSAAQARLTDAIGRAHRGTAGEAQEWVRLCPLLSTDAELIPSRCTAPRVMRTPRRRSVLSGKAENGAHAVQARLMLSTVGRGGDGQAIRDEILNIMHRNHIKEVKGTWMEEWHQKLHNNTTPDDVPICEAYLTFLRSHGDNGTYWRSLSDAGITRARLESFDRPIRCEPEMYHDRRDALIGEFQNYLSILKAVHSGADLQNAAKNAGGQLPGSAKGHLGYVLASHGSNQILPLIQSAVACRAELHAALPGNRDLLYLDLALEAVVRGAIERGVGSLGLGAAAFVGALLQNLVLTAGDNEELCYCLKAWQALPAAVQFGSIPDQLAALQATAVVDRIRRALGQLSEGTSARVEPAARGIGGGAGVEAWVVDLFAEEVVRGGPAFAVSLVLGTVEPALRRCAELGAWQVISPASVAGTPRLLHLLCRMRELQRACLAVAAGACLAGGVPCRGPLLAGSPCCQRRERRMQAASSRCRR